MFACCVHRQLRITVSYKNVVSACFDPDGTAVRNLLKHKQQTYRLAIVRDITEFRAFNIQNGCAECKVSFIENWDGPMPHVDHCGPKEFRHIVADFENQTQERDFAKYHRERAELQMLCENCNLRKGKS